jgi:RND family efflux transporter MFP subunit
MKRFLQFLIPLALIAVGLGAKSLFVATGPEAQIQEVVYDKPLVESMVVQVQEHPLMIAAWGEVQATSTSTVVARSSGELLELSQKLLPGASFAKGDLLARLDDTDARDNLALAESQVAQAHAALELEQAQADAAKKDWEEFGEGEAPAVVLREPQLAAARASLAAAEAQLAMANTQLSRTEVHAPFAGRSLDRMAETGQWVAPGTPLGRIYPTETLEIRLPLTRRDLGLLGTTDANSLFGRKVMLQDGVQTWTAQLDRMEASVDPGTRMMEAIATVAGESSDLPGALTPGMFLRATIEGRLLEQAFLIPSTALLDRNQLRVIDRTNQVHQVEIELIHDDGVTAVIGSGLEDGSRVLLTPLALFVEGMEVTLVNAEN